MLELNEETGQRETLFTEVILPLAISKTYTYRVPLELNQQIEIGKRVVVQFGKSRIYTAIIYKISNEPPTLYEAKYLIDVLDEKPIVTTQQLELWEWIADYYLCSIGEVMQAALPSALKLASETKVILLPESGYDKTLLSDKEFLIVDALEIHSELRVSDISKLLGQKTVFPLLKSLFDKNVIHISEEISERYKPRLKTFIKLDPFYQDADNLKVLFAELERAPKQLDALLAYMQLSRQYEGQVAKSQLLETANCGGAAIKTLSEKGIFISEKQVVSRFLESDEFISKDFLLSETQQAAFNSIQDQLTEKDVVLLHGVTSSGKTQLYIKFIEQAISAGRQALYLLPEIALTTQLVERLKNYFGNRVGVYHSKFNDNERAEVWNKLLKGEYDLVLGARSAVFLPFNNLGLIVIDEEHEPSYKQFDPAPRYHARDTAIYLAQIHHSKTLLGSATPSLESYYNARAGKYGLTELMERFGGSQLPAINVTSLTDGKNKQTLQGNFSENLVNAIRETLERKEQVILFQNRRGYTPLLRCKTCGYTPKCINCDVSLTFHKSTGKLHCHYCGYKQDTVSICPACGSTHIEEKGFGTERIEDDLSMIFPEARLARMDFDSTRSKNSFQRIIADFEDRKVDILVGTQMVTKGLDFAHVTLIGIISADSLLNYPDFRAYERSFQLLSQVAGRAGRRNNSGTVVIQAYDTEHRIIHQVIKNDYDSMAQAELIERRNFKYPPFYRMIQIDVKHQNLQQANYTAEKLGQALKQILGDRVVGPEFPLIGKIRNYYIKTLMLKIERSNVSIAKIKKTLQAVLQNFEADKNNKGIVLRVDVDPY
ncbi:primosomal protein N' [Pedobacter sp. HMF7647]|uniref:Replication restart protein PriA n=1 Tax=Hufsiella arboris TaxID=2695275 RepID=A0A7K1YCB9_9SPHI|nr:primosomal protein N' [Hufsiella arboris]MXV52233.1 primosomal protein N' [Hufsiella arboris]